MITHATRPLVLIILDGWGHRQNTLHNAIAAARTPTWDHLLKTYPHTLLSCCGTDVGLPEGQMGNSEVGHLTLGAGRVVYQDLTRISQAIQTGDFQRNPILLEALQANSHTDHTVHILGLLSPGGVHSHESHIHALIDLAYAQGARSIEIHAFLDGRDTPPKSASTSLENLERLCHRRDPVARIASISGRYYAMDRDNRWARTQAVYELLTQTNVRYTAGDAQSALKMAYARGESDEFVYPTWITSARYPTSGLHAGDSVFFMNFRADRARQLTQALLDPTFDQFARPAWFLPTRFVTLTSYSDALPTRVAFPATRLPNLLGECLEKHHLSQLRIAETEKYAHVTFFFNGGQHLPFQGEERLLIPSAKIATYDLAPEMSAQTITDQVMHAIQHKKHDFILCNYANADMVGHTGDFTATVQAIEVLDDCLKQILETVLSVGGELLITADHGNAECLFDEITQQAHTAHTHDPVPMIYIGRLATLAAPSGTLADVAPTLLYLLGLPRPEEMTGTSLILVA